MPLRGSAQRAERSGRGRSAIAFAQVFAVLSFACIVLLWKPITSGGWYAGGDVSGLAPIVRADGAEPARLPQIDVIVDILPWVRFSGEQLRSGTLPTWNPYNNSGVPHLANVQAGVFSPFNVPFYVLPMRLALIVSVYLVLMTAGLLACGLMRHLGTSRLAGLVTALAYMYCGYMMFWLRWPLAGVAALLPGLLWASSAFIRAAGWRPLVRRGCAVALLVALAVFAGHPETMFFGIVPAVGWSTATLLARRVTVVAFLKRISLLGIAGLAGLGLAAVQVVPFTQYLLQSPSFDGRQVHVYQSLRWAAAHVFPLAHGSPTMVYGGPYDFVNEFHEITIAYVGVFALFLAAIAVVSPLWTRRRAPLFFGGLAAVILVFLYDAFGVGELASRLWVFSLLMPSRAAIAWALCIAVLAGFGVDALRTTQVSQPIRRRTAVAGVAVLTVTAVAVLFYRVWHFHAHAFYRSPQERRLAWKTLVDHATFVAVTLVIGIGCALALALVTRRTAVKRLAAVGIVGVVFLQGAWLLRGQNPTVPGDRFMNFSPRVDRIARHIGDNQTVWLDDADLMPDVNLWFPTYSPDNYDVIGIDTYERLYRASLRPPESIEIAGIQLGLLTGPYDAPDLRALQTMGIRRVVTKRGYPEVTSSNLAARARPERPDGTGLYTYRWRTEAPAELVVYTEGIADGGAVDVVVTGDGMPTALRRSIEIHGGIGVTALPADLPPAGVMAATFSRPGGQRAADPGGRIVGTTIVASPLRGLVLDASVDGFQIFRVPGPSGFVSSPASASFVPSVDAALEYLRRPDFDPTDSVVIQRSDTAGAATPRGAGEPGVARVTATEPTRVTATVTRSDPGYAVFTQNAYPGWRATVNGRTVPIERANGTFMAVRVPSGTSTVSFRFESSAVADGLVVSLGCLALLVVALTSTFLGRRERP